MVYLTAVDISAVLGVLLLIIAICAGVVASKKNKSQNTSSSTSNGKPANSNLNGISPNSIPAWAKGGYLDPFTWYDTVDFNVTFTNATVGGLPIMGLNSTWDDSVRANPGVPPLNQPFQYGTMPIRGMNVGGWLSIEPFITPSFFSQWSYSDGVIDEWTLTSQLAGNAASTIEPHYSSFITKESFSQIRAAGFDHVRIPFSYWAVTTYSGDPYVAKISWRYLLRGIEYARQNGLRVNLDLHGIPGSQNGWNHSGRQGAVGWLNGPDGDLNAQRSLDIHNQLSQFFAQPRYANVVTMYGLVNEPKMVELDTEKVLNWTETAIRLVRGNNITAVVVFGDGFLGLDKWQGQLQEFDNLLLDVHQYVIFNDDQIVLKHSDKLNFACGGWTAQTLRSENKSTGFGPTLCGEWSQADTDCALYLNDVGVGSRWEGTLNSPNASLAVTTPQCPSGTGSPACECADANAAPSAYSAVYKQWLLQFAEAQMQSFEKGWGWFYWTWETEGATQWSWRLGAAAGILPAVATQRSFSCSDTIPDYGSLGLPENY
jgi:glucan 1,3-beta-glucosidase